MSETGYINKAIVTPGGGYNISFPFYISGMNQGTTELYQSPRYRMLENSHILLWLVKDTCWALEYKMGGMVMIAPTVGMAIYLLWRSRRSTTEFFHNIAVVLWILANSIWMIGEFIEQDWRPYSVVLFAAGLSVLALYYLFWHRKVGRRPKAGADPVNFVN